MDAYRDQATLYLGGVPMIRNDVIDFIKNDLLVFSLAVILTMTIMLSVLFRKIRWVLIPISISIIGALFMTGIISAIGWKVTVISANFFSLLLVMTLSVIIHLVVRFREISKENLDFNNSDTVRLTLSQMIRPCLYTVITTIAAFASLTASQVQPVIDFGLMMSIGVTVAFVLSFFGFAIIMMLLKKTRPMTNLKVTMYLKSLLFLRKKMVNQ